MSLGKPVRVLMMEDDAGQTRLMQRTLEREGYAVEVAGNGDAGLALYEAGAYDVLIVDHQMPGTGGFAVWTSALPWRRSGRNGLPGTVVHP